MAATATATWAALGRNFAARRRISSSWSATMSRRHDCRRCAGVSPAQLGGGLTRAAQVGGRKHRRRRWCRRCGRLQAACLRCKDIVPSTPGLGRVGYRSPRYLRFGWAAARLDDWANYVGAEATTVLVVICAPVVGGSPRGAVTGLAARRRPAISPNAGVHRGGVCWGA